MRVLNLWRYPVKSMQGESCEELLLGTAGAAGDRSFGVLDTTSGTVISAKRDGRLLQASARLLAGKLLVSLPGQDDLAEGPDLDEQLSDWLGRPVRLVAAASYGTGTFESPEDSEDDGSAVISWQGQAGSFVDESDLHLLATGDLDVLASERPDLHWDVRRFRPNVVVEADAGALGQGDERARLRLGEAEAVVEKSCSRCVMTTRAQPGGLDRELDILRHIAHAHNNDVGLRARVIRAGPVRRGDAVSVNMQPWT